MKKKVMCISLLSLLGLGALAGCSSNKLPSNSSNPIADLIPNEETIKVVAKMKSKPTYLSSAVTSANLMSGLGGNAVAVRSMKKANGDSVPPVISAPVLDSTTEVVPPSEVVKPSEEVVTPEVDPNIAKVEAYIDLASNLLMSPTKVTEEASDKPEFQTKVTYTRLTLEGTMVDYILYLTETPEVKKASKEASEPTKPTDVPVTSEEVKDPSTSLDSSKVEEEEEEEIEVNSTLKGLMIINGQELILEGKKEVETEGTEQEIKIVLRSFIDKHNYVKVVQESETEVEDGVTETELKYSYTVVENYKVVERDVFKIEKEGDESEIRMSKLKDKKISHMNVKEEKIENQSFLRINLFEDMKHFKIKAFVEVKEDGTKDLVYRYTVTEVGSSDHGKYPGVTEDNECDGNQSGHKDDEHDDHHHKHDHDHGHHHN